MISVDGKIVLTDLEELVDRDRCALVIVDMQHDFVEPEGLFGTLGIDLSIWSLLDHVDAMAPGPAPRVLLCSADSAFLRTHREALEARSCAIVEKPFDLDAFLDAVDTCLAPSPA